MIDLYYAPDNASLIIRIILEELGVEYNAILVDRSQKQQRSASYLALNPKGLIPVCIMDGQPVFETAAIALSLAERPAHYGAKVPIALALEPADSLRPQFLKWLFFISNTLHADLRQMFYAERYVGADEVLQQTYRAKTRDRLQQSFLMLDTRYRQTEQPYLFGSDPTIIDIYLGLCIRWAQIYPASARGMITVADYPSIKTMLIQLEGRAAVVSACEKEGVIGAFFSNPDYAKPTEGSAL